MNPIFTIEMEDGQVMKGELYHEIAPNSVANFVELANKGFYDGVIFHRVARRADDGVRRLHALGDLAERRILTVEVRRIIHHDEELGAR